MSLLDTSKLPSLKDKHLQLQQKADAKIKEEAAKVKAAAKLNAQKVEPLKEIKKA